MSGVVIVDYGMGNIKSVQRGLERAGGKPELSADPDELRRAGRVVLPGVGAFADGMAGLQKAGVIEALGELVSSGRPFLGICLGMQMLFDHSEEYSGCPGLGFVPGGVHKIPNKENGQWVRKIPHIGWSALQYPVDYANWRGSVLSPIPVGSFFYFVHSFMAIPREPANLLAQCDHEGAQVTAAVKKDNLTGLQFHPEKSGELGLEILRRFLRQ